MEGAVNRVVDRKLESIIREYAKQIITDKLRWTKVDVNVTTDKKE